MIEGTMGDFATTFTVGQVASAEALAAGIEEGSINLTGLGQLETTLALQGSQVSDDFQFFVRLYETAPTEEIKKTALLGLASIIRNNTETFRRILPRLESKGLREIRFEPRERALRRAREKMRKETGPPAAEVRREDSLQVMPPQDQPKKRRVPYEAATTRIDGKGPSRKKDPLLIYFKGYLQQRVQTVEEATQFITKEAAPVLRALQQLPPQRLSRTFEFSNGVTIRVASEDAGKFIGRSDGRFALMAEITARKGSHLDFLKQMARQIFPKSKKGQLPPLLEGLRDLVESHGWEVRLWPEQDPQTRQIRLFASDPINIVIEVSPEGDYMRIKVVLPPFQKDSYSKWLAFFLDIAKKAF